MTQVAPLHPEDQSPPNWVRLRAECNLDVSFDSVCSFVERDVAEMNKLSSAMRRQWTYQTESGGGASPTHYVIQKPEQGYGVSDAMVGFHRGENALEVFRKARGTDARETLFVVVPEWNPQESRCRLKVNGKELEVWEISRRALEPMFFGDAR